MEYFFVTLFSSCEGGLSSIEPDPKSDLCTDDGYSLNCSRDQASKLCGLGRRPQKRILRIHMTIIQQHFLDRIILDQNKELQDSSQINKLQNRENEDQPGKNNKAQ